MPEILKEFNVLTAVAVPESDTTNIQTDKCQEIKKQVEMFYADQVAVTATAAATIQSGKTPISIDHFMVKFTSTLSLCLFLSTISNLYSTDFT